MSTTNDSGAGTAAPSRRLAAKSSYQRSSACEAVRSSGLQRPAAPSAFHRSSTASPASRRPTTPLTKPATSASGRRFSPRSARKPRNVSSSRRADAAASIACPSGESPATP